MKRKGSRSYVFLALVLFGCLNLPKSIVDPFRHQTLCLAIPLWKKLFYLRSSFSFPLSLSQKEQRVLKEKIQKLEAENGHLQRQNDHLRKRLFSEDRIESCLKKFKEVFPNIDGMKDFFLRRQKHAKALLDLERQSLFSRVVYRDSSAWNRMMWIDVGEEDNEALGYVVAQKNSPVLAGKYLVGVVEVVKKKQSLVRLLTDSSLVVSVRAVRGGLQRKEMLHLLDQLILELTLNRKTLFSVEEEKVLFEKLGHLKEELQREVKTQYLAKGELIGTSSSSYRSLSLILKGVGFNYDFKDVEGVPRELKSGKAYEALVRDRGQVLIQEGDLLVTTGMEGVFPADLPVAIVSKVFPLKEGAASYSIEAKLCATDINALSEVVVLPSLNFDQNPPFATHW